MTTTIKKEWYLKEECFNRGSDLENTFYVAKDTSKGGKIMTSFKDVNEFLTFQDTQIGKHLYECISKERILYVDIDEPKNGVNTSYWKDRSLNDITSDFVSHFNKWIKESKYSNKSIDYETDLYVLVSTRPDIKKSIHLFIRNGFVFKNHIDIRDFMNEFSNYLSSIDTGLEIDTNVYSKDRLLRTIGSTKIGTDRELIRSDFNKLSLNCDRSLFFASNIDPELKAVSKRSCIVMNTPLGREMNLSYLKYVKGFKMAEEKIINQIERNDTFSENEVINMFKHLSVKRWDDYATCLNLIWLGIKYGLTNDDIHLFCKQSDKYSDEWVNNTIEKYQFCNFTIGTVKYFLRQDVDKETYNTIVPSEDDIYATITCKKKKDRTKNEQLYLEVIKNSITKKSISFLTGTSGYIERKDTFVKVRDINKGKISVVKAGLGKGKTTATVNHINNFEYDCIIILTPRRTYAKSTLSRVKKEIDLPDGEEFFLYSDIKGGIKAKYIIIQVESLCRFKYEFEKGNTLVILDEVESLLYQMTSHKTHGINHMENLDMFERIIKESSKVVCLDAFISNKTLDVLKNMSCEFNYYNYTKSLEKRTAIHLPKKNILKQKLIKELEQGKKCFFFCSSRKQLTDYFLSDIRAQFPNKKILEYHSKKLSLDLTTINDQWKQADLIVCTCTITVGCNFDLKDVFNSIFVYASACSRNLVRDIFQSCYRVRHIIDKKMYFTLDTRHNGLNLPTDVEEITNTINDKVLFHKIHYEKFLKMELTEGTPKWVKHLLINNIYESNMSIMNLEQLFYKYLELCNYDIKDEEEEELDDLDIKDEESNLVFLDYQYEDIPEITFTQRQELLTKKKLEPLEDIEEFTLNKSFFQATLIVEGRSNIKLDEQISLWNVYMNYGKSKFRNLSYEKGVAMGTLRICDIISSSFPELADNLSRKLEDIIEITQQFNLKNSQDFKTIDRGTIVDNLSWLETHSKRFHTNFGLRQQKRKGEFTLKNGSELLSKIFSSWGFSKIKKGKQVRGRVNGKRVDMTDYKCENTEDVEVYKYLEAKAKKQYEKKVRNIKGIFPLE